MCKLDVEVYPPNPLYGYLVVPVPAPFAEKACVFVTYLITLKLKQQTFIASVSEDQKFKSSLVCWFWLIVSHKVTFWMSSGATNTEGLPGAGGSFFQDDFHGFWQEASVT